MARGVVAAIYVRRFVANASGSTVVQRLPLGRCCGRRESACDTARFHLPLIEKGVTYVVHVKGELGGINFGLRPGSADIFNSRILNFGRLTP